MTRISITLPAEHLRILRELAETKFEGNESAAIRRLLETHPVTKSAFALSGQTT